MAHTKPKRVDELSPLEMQDTYKTPVRRSITENTTKKAFFPKRISELSPLELSDDEERNSRNNAFLNDSFIELSSEKKSEKIVPIESNPTNNNEKEVEIIEIKDEPEAKKDSASRQLRFGNGCHIPEPEADRPKITLFSKIQSSSFIKKSDENQPSTRELVVAPLQSNSFLDNNNLNNVSVEVKRTISAPTKLTNDFNTPKVGPLMKPNVLHELNSNVDDDTPLKDFQMPSATAMRRLHSSQHRTLLSSANQTKKCRSDLEKEFKSQKVLFTTPSAISRPTIKMMNNLALDDSLNCYKSPMANLPPVKEENLEKQMTQENKENQSLDKIDGLNEEKETVPEKQKVLRINGKDFLIKERIGQGGSSSVFLAEHKETKLECALKVVNLRADPSLVDGYIKEVKILAMLQDKVNVIRLYEYALVSSESLLYMVMEKGDSDLRKILSTYKTSLPLYTLMAYWHQMLQSVNYIHEKDVIHSDLKPENFLMVRGRLKLIDFGISSKMAVDATSIIKYSQVGTFNYISPEALMDTSTGDSPMTKKNQPKIKISPKSDVWSLGCILYLLLYKRTPFAHIKNIYAKMQTIIDPNKKIEYAELPNFYPSMLLEMVQQCLKHNPKERASVADLLNFPFDMVIPIKDNQ